MDNNFPIIRLGEMYLTRAEALARHNDDWSLAFQTPILFEHVLEFLHYTSITPEEFLAERGREMFQESSRSSDHTFWEI